MNSQSTELQEMRRKLEAGEISASDVLATLAARGTRPWSTKEWKFARNARIGQCCQQCGTAEPPLVLQHTKKRIPIDGLVEVVHRELREEWTGWKDAHLIEVDEASLPLDGRGCPKCGSETIRYQTREANWKCFCKAGGLFCHHTFAVPRRVVSYESFRKISKAAGERRQMEFDVAHDLSKQVATLALDQDLRYLSLEPIRIGIRW